MPAADGSRPVVFAEPGRFRPGRKELAVFALLFVLGSLVWLASSPGVTSRLLGIALPLPPLGGTALSLYFVPIVCGLLSFASGFVFPRGFWLWGVALALHAPFTEALTTYMMYRDGIELAAADGPGEIVGYGVFVAALIFFAALCYTALSALGMGLRYLTGRLLSRRDAARDT